MLALCNAAVNAVDNGDNILVLSDRGVDATQAAIPSLLALSAVSAVQQRLVREGIRTHVGLIIEAAAVREVHHVACLLRYGAAAVNPLAIDAIKDLVMQGRIEGQEQAAVGRYVDATDDGVLKAMSKLGISTLQSYRGAQMFEAIGINADVIADFFTGTPCRLGGLSIAALHSEVRTRHRRAFGIDDVAIRPSQTKSQFGGLYVFKREGERHRWDPFTVKALQKASRTGDDDALWEVSRALADGDDNALAPTALRDLLTFSPSTTAVPIEEVESAVDIVKRFGSGAMSLGALSPEARRRTTTSTRSTISSSPSGTCSRSIRQRASR